MIYKTQGLEININLGGDCFKKLLSGEWEIGFINRNPEIINKKNENYYHNETDKISNSIIRTFNNKVNVLLVNGQTVFAHIIHWNPTDGYFIVSFNKFWDRFDI